MPLHDDEFYVGYLDHSPPGIAAWSRRIAALVLALGIGLGFFLVFGQDRFDLLFWTLQRSGLTKRSDALATLPTQSWTSH